jgi:hypothetical protein
LTLEEEGEAGEGPLEFGEDVGVQRWVRGDGAECGEDPTAGEAESRKIEELKNKSSDGQPGLLQFGSSTSEVSASGLPPIRSRIM